MQANTQDMRGVLFREGEKRSEKSPDYRGRLRVGGREYRLSGWVHEKNGRKYLSLAVSEAPDGGRRDSSEEEVPF